MSPTSSSPTSRRATAVCVTCTRCGGPPTPDLVIPVEDRATIERCYESLVAARVELHRETRRRGDVLRLEDQDAVATRLGRSSSDELMAEIAAAARSIAWIADEAWRATARHRPPRSEERQGAGWRWSATRSC